MNLTLGESTVQHNDATYIEKLIFKGRMNTLLKFIMKNPHSVNYATIEGTSMPQMCIKAEEERAMAIYFMFNGSTEAPVAQTDSESNHVALLRRVARQTSGPSAP